MRTTAAALLFVGLFIARSATQPIQPDWPQVETETMQHFQALLRIDTPTS